MATIPPPTIPSPRSTRSNPSPHMLTFNGPKFTSPLKKPSPTLLPHFLSRASDSAVCYCRNCSDDASPPPDRLPDESFRWDTTIQGGIRNAVKWFDECVNRRGKTGVNLKEAAKGSGSTRREVEVKDGDEEWDWVRWKKHFDEIDEQERILSILKLQLNRATYREDYEDAARLKVAIAAAAANDAVGRVISQLNKAIEEERYDAAAFVRDFAGAGLVGWWAGLSDNSDDPFGHVIRISAEHGRYVARSYSPRQLATAAAGTPIFEIFLRMNKKGEYKQQAVYLRRSKVPHAFPNDSSKSSDLKHGLNTLSPLGDKDDQFSEGIEDVEDGDDWDDGSDIADGSAFENILRDLIPGAKDVKVKVLKVTTAGKIDRELISKVVEQIMEEEEDGEEEKDEDDNEDKDVETQNVDTDDEVKDEIEDEQNEIEMDGGNETSEGEERSQIAVKVVVAGLVNKKFGGEAEKHLLREPARLEKKDRFSFSFSVEKDKRRVSDVNPQSLVKEKLKLLGNRSIDHVMIDLARSIGKGKLPLKVLNDVGQLINLTISQAQSRQSLSGTMTFNRIELPVSSDPLNGLYVGSHGLYASEVIHLRRKFGQWQENGSKKGFSNLEFYEYVEAVKLTGDQCVRAGEVAFRAKVGPRYQLPHKGIIPEEFGVVARYRGQGRLAEPGFQNPRWVDGELVILDGKYIRGGPVVGFLYWAPEYHFLVFFSQLRLQE